MPTIKPDVNDIWASSGSITDPGQAKTLLGWIAEIPTFQNFNWLLNRQDAFNSHVNDYGLAHWDNATDYPINAWARSTLDEEVYVSLVTPNVNNEPSANPASWELLSTNLPGGLGTASVEDVGSAVNNVFQVLADGTNSFGIGATNPVLFVGDMNTLTQSAQTSVGAAATNKPPTASGGGTVFTQAFDTTDGTQVFAGVVADETFYRRRVSGSYQSWTQVLSSGVPLGTAAFVNTGVTAGDVPLVSNLPTVAVTSLANLGGINVSTPMGSTTVELDINDLTVAGVASVDNLAFSDEGSPGDPTRRTSISNILGLSQSGKTFTSQVIISNGGLLVTGDVEIDGDLDVSGDITGDSTVPSDERLKNITKDIDPDTALDFILNARTVHYTWNEKAAKQSARLKEGSAELGFIAQDFREHFPELVHGSEKKFYSLDYERSPAILAAAFKALYKEHLELKTKVEEFLNL